MHRKDYVAIAATLKKVRASYAPHWDSNLFRAVDDVARALADTMAAGNERFNRAAFLSAAGVEQK